MLTARQIRVREIIRDIRSGLTEGQLGEKYSLSPRALSLVCRKLLDARAISRTELCNALSCQDVDVVVEDMRELDRVYLDFELPVYEPCQPEVQGLVRDITEEGIGLIGLEACVDEVKTLVVLGDLFGEVAPFEFEARCRWCAAREDVGRSMSGYQICSITPEDFVELQKLARLVTVRT